MPLLLVFFVQPSSLKFCYKFGDDACCTPAADANNNAYFSKLFSSFWFRWVSLLAITNLIFPHSLFHQHSHTML